MWNYRVRVLRYIVKVVFVLSLMDICKGRASSIVRRRPTLAKERADKAIRRNGGSSMSSSSSWSLKVRAQLGLKEVDNKIIRMAVPTIANFAINPIVGGITLHYVGKMKNTLALAGMSAANQIYVSAFILFSYLPSITGTLVSTEYAEGKTDGIQDAVCQSMLLGILLSSVTSLTLFFKPRAVLRSVLSKDAPAMVFAEPYLVIRSLSVLPSIVSSISFAAFRGVLDLDTPLYISLFTSIVNIILHPILIFRLHMGVKGAAAATLAAELIASTLFLHILHKRNMISFRRLFQIPKWSRISPLIKGGAALQLRNLSMNVVFMYVSRVVQSLDDTGIAASAHIMTYQIFSVGAIVLLALSTVAQTLVPNEMVQRQVSATHNSDKTTPVQLVGGVQAAKTLVNRMMKWGFFLGACLGLIQLLLLPFLHAITPIEEVQKLAKRPSYVACIAQLINGLVFVGEGVMVGCRDFLQLSIGTVISTIGAIIALQILPARYGLSGVWMSFIVFNLCRLFFVYIHQVHIGPFHNHNTVQKNEETRI